MKTKNSKKTRKTINKRINNKKYNLQKNNYFGIIFLLIILVISVTIYVKNKEKQDLGLDPIYNSISAPNKEITKPNDQINELLKITHGGDLFTFKIYQSLYSNEPIDITKLSNETILYLTYKYIENNYDLSIYNKYITCDIASTVGIDKNIYQCGGNKYSLSTFQINTFITKELIKDTAKEIFNINLKEFTNFYTNEDNLCYYENNEFYCISKKIQTNTLSYNKEFVKALIYDNKIEIIENYYFIKNNTKYKYFNSKEEGSSLFISTFVKTNGHYHWQETKPYIN